jgi:hypothetical protein
MQKICAEYKRRTTDPLQIHLEVREMLPDIIREFCQAVATICTRLAAAGHRCTFKLTDALNATVQELSQRHPSLDLVSFLAACFGVTEMPTPAGLVYRETDVPSDNGMHVVKQFESGARQRRVASLHALPLSVVEDLFKTSKKATRDTNAFMMRAADTYALWLLDQADASARAAKVRRIGAPNLLTSGGRLQTVLLPVPPVSPALPVPPPSPA